MRISQNTAKVIAPLIRGMAQAGTLPKSEASRVTAILNESSKEPTLPQNRSIQNKMLTTAEAAKRLGVCSKTVLVMRKDGLLQGIKLTGSNKSLRFPESEVEQLINIDN